MNGSRRTTISTKIVQGCPAPKSCHVVRATLMKEMHEAFTRTDDKRMVGLVGRAGSGKSTAASNFVNQAAAHKLFPDGIVWLSANAGAGKRLEELAANLANLVHECIVPLDEPFSNSNDAMNSIKHGIARAHGGQGMRCLVVVDNVWDENVIPYLKQAGTSVLFTTRPVHLVRDEDAERVDVVGVRMEEAREILRKASQLPIGVSLPPPGDKLIELCGRMPLDLEFVGKWACVHGRVDAHGWDKAVKILSDKLNEVIGGSFETGTDIDPELRRKAVLQAGRG